MQVTRPSWSHYLIANGFAIQLGLIYTKRCDIKPRLLHTHVYIKHVAQQSSRLGLAKIFVPIGTDEVSFPIFCVKKSYLNGDWFAPIRDLSIDTPNAYSHCEAFTGR